MNNKLKLVEKLSNALGAPGYEYEVVEAIYDDLKDFGEIEVDAINNLIVRRKVNDGITFLFDAHLDEVAFMVKNIYDNGTLEIMPIASWIETNVPAHRWKVRNNKGEYITGITASKPPHFMTEEDRQKGVSFETIALDVGATSKEEVINDFGIIIGEPVVPDVKFEYDEKHDLMHGKAFDCRVGCASLVLTANEIVKRNIDVNINCVLSAQEENGGRGAEVAAKTVDADFAIVFEGTPADDTFTEYPRTSIGKGPMLRHIDVGMISHPGLQHFALSIAKKYGIKVQDAVRSGGGTNGRFYHKSKKATPTIVIAVPVRYIHTHHGMAKSADIDEAVELAVKIIEDFDKEAVLNYGFKRKLK